MFRKQIKILQILVIKLFLLETKVFQIKQSPQQIIPNKHAGGLMDQITHAVNLQVDNNLKNPTKLELLRNNLWLISYELNNSNYC
jgi:hypothetical protein